MTAGSGSNGANGSNGRIYGKFTIVSEELLLGSRPTQRERELFLDEVDVERRVLCRRYDNCLTHAASERWLAWSCTSCDVDDQLSPTDQYHDLEGLAEALRAMGLTTKSWRPPRS